MSIYPLCLFLLVLIIKGGGFLDLSTLSANDLQEVSPPTKSAWETKRERERETEECQRTSVIVWKVCLRVGDATHDFCESVS